MLKFAPVLNGTAYDSAVLPLCCREAKKAMT